MLFFTVVIGFAVVVCSFGVFFTLIILPKKYKKLTQLIEESNKRWSLSDECDSNKLIKDIIETNKFIFFYIMLMIVFVISSIFNIYAYSNIDRNNYFFVESYDFNNKTNTLICNVMKCYHVLLNSNSCETVNTLTYKVDKNLFSKKINR